MCNLSKQSVPPAFHICISFYLRLTVLIAYICRYPVLYKITTMNIQF